MNKVKDKDQKKLIQIQYIPINLLKEWNRNPRRNDPAVDKLSKLIEAHGFINPVIATNDNVIRAGHTRVKAAKKAGLKEVPVIYIDMGSKQAEAYALSDNKSNEWSEWDFSLLKDLFTEFKLDDSFDTDLTGFDLEEIENLFIIDKVNGKDSEWVGMPEFDIKEKDLVIIIKFENEADRENFTKTHDIKIRRKASIFSWSTVWPYKENEDKISLIYE